MECASEEPTVPKYSHQDRLVCEWTPELFDWDLDQTSFCFVAYDTVFKVIVGLWDNCKCIKPLIIMKTRKDGSGFVSNRECIDFNFIRCPIGYKVNDDKNKCVDIDECKTTQCPYRSKCINTEGSYRCQCNNGYKPVGQG